MPVCHSKHIPLSAKNGIKTNSMRTIFKNLFHIPHEIAFFLAAWCFSALWYGEVFLMAREYSYFAFDSMLMRDVVGQPWGYLWAAGRAVLTIFAYPWLGGLAVAAILTCESYFAGQLLRLPSKWRALQYLPAAACMFHWTWLGFDAFVYAEPGKILGIPLCATVLLAVAALATGALTTRHRVGRAKSGHDTTGQAAALLTALLLPACAGLYDAFSRPYVRTTARLQRLMAAQQWDDMIRTAQAYDSSNRQVAAYHAIALHHTGRLLEDLFNIPYDFEPIKMTFRNGSPTDGHDIYEADCDLHAGLLQSAYKKDMELNVLDGIRTSRLKRMVKYALAKGETNLALRYLYVLSRQPLEGRFTSHYLALEQSPEAMHSDGELAFLRQASPTSDFFENYLMAPPFIGYYAALRQTDNKIQADAATAAALYTKQMKHFLYHAQKYVRQGGVLPNAVGDALALAYANGQLPQAESRRLAPYLSRLSAFTKDAEGKTDIGTDDGLRLFKSYRGYYPYYYFFGNRKPSESGTETTEEGGVN